MSSKQTLGKIIRDKCPAASAPRIVITLRDDTQTFQQVLALQGQGNNLAISWNNGHPNMNLVPIAQRKQKEIIKKNILFFKKLSKTNKQTNEKLSVFACHTA